jgi:predicted HicB family RNase H-like nuclease
MSRPNYKHIQVEVSPEQHKAVKIVAATEGLSICSLVRRAIDAELARIERKRAKAQEGA